MSDPTTPIQLSLPLWVAALLVIALLLNAIEPLARWTARAWGVRPMLYEWIYKPQRKWPVEIVVNRLSTTPGEIAPYLNVLLGFTVRYGVPEVVLRNLEIVEVDTGVHEGPWQGAARGEQWVDGMRLTAGDAINVRFTFRPAHRKVCFQVIANGRLCRSDETELPLPGIG